MCLSDLTSLTPKGAKSLQMGPQSTFKQQLKPLVLEFKQHLKSLVSESLL